MYLFGDDTAQLEQCLSKQEDRVHAVVLDLSDC